MTTANLVPASTRRARVREATTTQIKDTARQLLVAHGVSAVSLRAIARELGMTAPAIYRYFLSREDLLDTLVADSFDELSGSLTRAAEDAAAGGAASQLIAAARELRRWALMHPAEFGLLFGTPLPGAASDPSAGTQETVTDEACRAFGLVFAELFGQLWERQPFPVAADHEIDPGLAAQLRTYADQLGRPLPLGAVLIYLSSWVRLYGLIALEVFGHLSFALDDGEALFETELRSLAGQLGIDTSAAG